MPSDHHTVSIRPLRSGEVTAADRLFRLAFGTFLGLPEPETFGGDAALVGSRWRAAPTRALAADDGTLAGLVMATTWGSLGVVGPLAVRPDRWDSGIGQLLMGTAMEQFAAWGVRHRGLFTFPNSPKHIHLYEKVGFSARFLTPLFVKEIAPGPLVATDAATYAALGAGDRAAALAGCRAVSTAVYEGLDLGAEIAAVQENGFGETVLLMDGSRVTGFAVCHCGAGTEAGSGTCYVKFGTVVPGAGASERFARLLAGAEAVAQARGLGTLSLGVNMGCTEAYRQVRGSGFRTAFIGLAMEQPDEPGYHRPDRYVISDWR